MLEGGTAESAGMGGAFAREAGHLSARHGAFLAHWHRLLDLEEAGLLDKRAEVWRLHGVPQSPAIALRLATKRYLVAFPQC